MPSSRLFGYQVTLAEFDVVGRCDNGNFVSHAALAKIDGDTARDSVSILHMGPPLQENEKVGADVRGTANLDENERQKIRVFAMKHLGEHSASVALEGLAMSLRAKEFYCIHPHAMRYDESDGRYSRIRFSCVGFVYEAYRSARIELLKKSSLPQVDLVTLKKQYPESLALLDNMRFRQSMGLPGNGPWPVMLCGYLFHALNRTDADIRSTPYVPREADSCFP